MIEKIMAEIEEYNDEYKQCLASDVLDYDEAIRISRYIEGLEFALEIIKHELRMAKNENKNKD